MNKKLKEKLHIIEKRYLEVTKYSYWSAHIVVPQSLIGQEVEVIFHRKLSAEEIEKMRLLKLKRELKMIRNKKQYMKI